MKQHYRRTVVINPFFLILGVVFGMILGEMGLQAFRDYQISKKIQAPPSWVIEAGEPMPIDAERPSRSGSFLQSCGATEEIEWMKEPSHSPTFSTPPLPAPETLSELYDLKKRIGFFETRIDALETEIKCMKARARK